MSAKNHLLVIDDDPLTLDCFRLLFPRGSVSVDTVMSALDGLRQFEAHRPDAVILDVRLPDLSGLEAFRRFQEIDARVPIILITGQGTAGTAIEAMRVGAYEYVIKPLDPAPLRELVARAFEIRRLMRVPARIAEPEQADDEADVLVGNCPAMQEVYKTIGRVAPQDMTVLVLGESGTGKELVARAIYHYSNRARGPFLAINCAAIPDTLLESELFGHERGAFTGADHRRIGKFEQCHGGTMFLDEVGDMTPLTQTKILRVLQERKFERVGGNEVIEADVRVIAATNQNLAERVAAQRFRSDLYYRLNVMGIKLPPLRERSDDLPLLANHFLRRCSRTLGKEVDRIAPEALDLLRRYPWPGNVRELQSVMQQAVLQAAGPVLLSEFLPAPIRGEERTSSASARTPNTDFPDLARFVQERLSHGSTDLHAELQAATERQLFLQVLRHTDNNLTQAARLLGLSRATLRSKLTTLGLVIERSTSVEAE